MGRRWLGKNGDDDQRSELDGDGRHRVATMAVRETFGAGLWVFTVTGAAGFEDRRTAGNDGEERRGALHLELTAESCWKERRLEAQSRCGGERWNRPGDAGVVRN